VVQRSALITRTSPSDARGQSLHFIGCRAAADETENARSHDLWVSVSFHIVQLNYIGGTIVCQDELTLHLFDVGECVRGTGKNFKR